MKRRDFIKTAGAGGATAGSLLYAPYVFSANKPKIKWRLQTYAGSALAAHVIQPQVEEFNKVAHGEMEIELYNAGQLVPHGELFRAVQDGTVDAAQSDDDSMAAPVDISAFAAYFPFASRYFLDVPALFHWYGLDKIWEEAYAEVENVTWLSSGSWDPCCFATKDPIRSIEDFKGKRLFMFPTVGRFMERFGVVPVSLPFEDVEVALQTGELDGVAWSGITEDYNNGWAEVTNYYLANPVSGAWLGSYFVNTESWDKVPEHLKQLYMMSIKSSHYYRLHWYWWGEAYHRVKKDKLEVTWIPDDDWKKVENEAMKFWDEIAQKSERNARVVEILKDYQETMRNAGPPYRYETG